MGHSQCLRVIEPRGARDLVMPRSSGSKSSVEASFGRVAEVRWTRVIGAYRSNQSRRHLQRRVTLVSSCGLRLGILIRSRVGVVVCWVSSLWRCRSGVALGRYDMAHMGRRGR